MGALHRATTTVALLLLVGGCTPDFVRSGDRPSPSPTPRPVTVGRGLRPAEPGMSGPAVGEEDDDRDIGTFLLTVVDANDGNPEGIPLRIRGPRDADVESGPGGRVEFRGPPGTYGVEIALGCTGALEILSATSGRFGIVAGATGRAELGVRWRHRFAPSPPVYSSIGPYWPIGDEVEVRYGLVDRCRADAPAPDQPFPTWSFETNERLDLAREPVMRSDHEGHAYVHVACDTSGPAELVVYDTENPPDRLDLVASDYGFGGAPSCGA